MRGILVAAVALSCCTEATAPPVERVATPAAEAPPPAESAPPAVVVPSVPLVADEPAPPPVAGKPPAGLVDLRASIPTLRLSIGYATADNFTGAPLPGYEVPGAWAHPALALALGDVDRALAQTGLGLLVYDAYRPKRATEGMMAWVRAHGRQDLVNDGYIAARSQHNRGLAIDLTLVDRAAGTPLDMGGAWDTFDPSSAAFAATGPALDHRKQLRDVMTRHGFVPHQGEWWHFSLPHAEAPVLDVPYRE